MRFVSTFHISMCHATKALKLSEIPKEHLGKPLSFF